MSSHYSVQDILLCLLFVMHFLCVIYKIPPDLVYVFMFYLVLLYCTHRF